MSGETTFVQSLCVVVQYQLKTTLVQTLYVVVQCRVKLHWHRLSVLYNYMYIGTDFHFSAR